MYLYLKFATVIDHWSILKILLNFIICTKLYKAYIYHLYTLCSGDWAKYINSSVYKWELYTENFNYQHTLENMTLGLVGSDSNKIFSTVFCKIAWNESWWVTPPSFLSFVFQVFGETNSKTAKENFPLLLTTAIFHCFCSVIVILAGRRVR